MIPQTILHRHNWIQFLYFSMYNDTKTNNNNKNKFGLKEENIFLN
jgi:hypothetical protein